MISIMALQKGQPIFCFTREGTIQEYRITNVDRPFRFDALNLSSGVARPFTEQDVIFFYASEKEIKQYAYDSHLAVLKYSWEKANIILREMDTIAASMQTGGPLKLSVVPAFLDDASTQKKILALPSGRGRKTRPKKRGRKKHAKQKAKPKTTDI